MRERYKPGADAFLEAHQDIVINQAYRYRGKWHTLFPSSSAPIHLEIGVGKGQFLVRMASRYPHVNFIGVEQSKSIIVTAAEKIMASGLENVLIVLEDAENLLELFAAEEISKLYLNFSDPWPKKRHEKRRLTNSAFLEKYRTILVDGADIVLKTDNRTLFEYSLIQFNRARFFFVDVNLHLDQDEPGNIQSEYEEKFVNRGERIYRIVVQHNLDNGG